MRVLPALLLLVLPSALLADPTMAPEPLSYTQLPDARQEAAAQALMQTIRCVVCQGQSIADSDADLAGDMRALVRRRIAAGDKPGTVRDYLVARYGGWISFRPPLDAVTWPLWVAPVALLLLGVAIGRLAFRRRRT